jgi:hypothetical protein
LQLPNPLPQELPLWFLLRQPQRLLIRSPGLSGPCPACGTYPRGLHAPDGNSHGTIETDNRRRLDSVGGPSILVWGAVPRSSQPYRDERVLNGPRQQAFCWKFTIPVTEQPKVLALLDEYNLNAFSLFGSEEHLMETLATREFR